jgi:superfamily II RNA helicase
VNFTQRECGELAQGATSANLASREVRNAVADAIRGVRFDTAYGKDVKRFLGHGIGIHHAGLLPKYRLLVERLAQQGLLRVIFGTDTLGVGVNVPIRTVVLNKLAKFDGEKTGILRAREFHQIAGRAGRKGFDDRGRVVCQAPEHVIENRRLEQKGSAKKPAKKRPPRDFVPWSRETFEQLVVRPPEALRSQFLISHGLILAVLQRDAGADYGAVIRLLNRSHENDASKARQRRRAATLFRSLVTADVLELEPSRDGGREVRVAPGLESDFALHDTLSLYLVEAVAALDPESESYALEVLSVVEAVQENPRPILDQQTRLAKDELIARLKAEGIEYEERMRRLDEVTHPKPEEEFLHQTFSAFAARHPWAREDDVRPKSIARDMVERYLGFRDYVAELSLARSEGLLLRYLSQVHNALVKSLPAAAKTDAVYDVIAFLRAAIAGVDTSLLEAWESLVAPAPEAPALVLAPRFDLALQPRLLTARVRSELLSLVRALVTRDYEEAAHWVHPDPADPWDAPRFEAALAPFHADYGALLFTPEARRAHHTSLRAAGPRRFDVTQVLVDANGDNAWALHGEVDLRQDRDPELPLVRLIRVGT